MNINLSQTSGWRAGGSLYGAPYSRVKHVSDTRLPSIHQTNYSCQYRCGAGSVYKQLKNAERYLASHTLQPILFTPIMILPHHLRCYLLSNRPRRLLKSDLRYLANVMRSPNDRQRTTRELTWGAWMSFFIVNSAAS